MSSTLLSVELPYPLCKAVALFDSMQGVRAYKCSFGGSAADDWYSHSLVADLYIALHLSGQLDLCGIQRAVYEYNIRVQVQNVILIIIINMIKYLLYYVLSLAMEYFWLRWQFCTKVPV